MFAASSIIALRRWSIVAGVSVVTLAPLSVPGPAEAARRFAFENTVRLARHNELASGFAWSLDGERIAYFTVQSPPSEPFTTGGIRMYDLVIGEDREVVTISPANQAAGSANTPVSAGLTFSPNGEYLLFASRALDPSNETTAISRVKVGDLGSVVHGLLTAADFGAPPSYSVLDPDVTIGSDGVARLTVAVIDESPEGLPPPTRTFEGLYVLTVSADGLPFPPSAKKVIDRDPSDQHFTPLGGRLSPSGNEVLATVADDPCTDWDPYVFNGIQAILADTADPIASRTDPRAFAVTDDDLFSVVPNWSSDGTLIYFSADVFGENSLCEPQDLNKVHWEILVAETATILAGIPGALVVRDPSVQQFAPRASPGGTRFVQNIGGDVIAGTWRITDEVAVDPAGHTVSDFTLDDATGIRLSVPVGTMIGSPTRACRPCDDAAVQLGLCTNVCFTPDCDEPSRTIDLTGSGACSQFDGDQGNCELAWDTTDDGVPMSCFYDGTLAECRRCDRSEQDPGNCTNECLPCNDVNNLNNQNFMPGPQGCRALDGNESTCYRAYQLSNEGVPEACVFTAGQKCFAAEPTLQPYAGVANDCFGIRTAHGDCEDASRTTFVGLGEGCRQFDDDEAGCDGAWHVNDIGLPTSCYYESFPATLKVSAFTPLSPLKEAELAATQGDVIAIRDYSPDGQTFGPPAQLVVSYSDLELEYREFPTPVPTVTPVPTATGSGSTPVETPTQGPTPTPQPATVDEHQLTLAKFNDATGKYDIELPVIDRDPANNTITSLLDSFSRYGAALPLRQASLKDVVKCARTVNKSAGKFLQADAKTLSKCQVAKVKVKHDERCPDPTGSAEGKAAFDKIVKASSKLKAGIDKKCGGEDKICSRTTLVEEVSAGRLGFGDTCPGFQGVRICQAGTNDGSVCQDDPECPGGTCVACDGAIDLATCADTIPCVECIAMAATGQLDGLLTAGLNLENPIVDRDRNKCQQEILKATWKFYVAKSKLLAKCWDKHVGKGTPPCDFVSGVCAPGAPTEGTPCTAGRATGVCGAGVDCVLGDGKYVAKIQKAEAKKIAAICKRCGGVDKLCNGNGDLDPAVLYSGGFNGGTCPAVTVPYPRPARPGDADPPEDCGTIDVSTLKGLVDCIDCVAEFNVDCATAIQVVGYSAYPAACQ